MEEGLPILQRILESAWIPWVVVPGALFVLWTLWQSNRRSRSRPSAQTSVPPDEEEGARELRKEVRRLENEISNLSKFLLLLPEFTKQLNSPMEHHQIGPLLVGMVERLFEPQQILLFYTDRKVNQLILHGQKGFDERAGRSFQIPIGQGRIGWVAQHQTTMDTQDFLNLMRSDGDRIDSPAEARIQADLCTALVHEGETLGVISMGGILRHLKHEKRVATLIGDLGSIAMYNSMLFRQMREAANSDGLTKLYNKKFFLYLLGNEIVKAEKARSALSLFLFDLDHFKKLNDTRGHLAGDEVLKTTGRLLRDTIREEDVAVRYGGEEFILLLPNTHKEGGLIAGDKIRRALENFVFLDEESKPIDRVTLSGGVSTFPDDGRTSTELIQAADSALYRAKQEGRNRVLPAETKFFSNLEDEILVHETRP